MRRAHLLHACLLDVRIGAIDVGGAVHCMPRHARSARLGSAVTRHCALPRQHAGHHFGSQWLVDMRRQAGWQGCSILIQQVEEVGMHAQLEQVSVPEGSSLCYCRTTSWQPRLVPGGLTNPRDSTKGPEGTARMQEHRSSIPFRCVWEPLLVFPSGLFSYMWPSSRYLHLLLSTKNSRPPAAQQCYLRHLGTPFA